MRQTRTEEQPFLDSTHEARLAQPNQRFHRPSPVRWCPASIIYSGHHRSVNPPLSSFGLGPWGPPSLFHRNVSFIIHPSCPLFRALFVSFFPSDNDPAHICVIGQTTGPPLSFVRASVPFPRHANMHCCLAFLPVPVPGFVLAM